MIGTLVHVHWTNLKRDRVAQLLAFLLPVIFFSIFATVFGNQGNGSTARIHIAVADEDHTGFSARVVAGLSAEKGLVVRTTTEGAGKGQALNRARAETLVKSGEVPVAVVLPAGLEQSVTDFGRGDRAPRIALLADVSDPVAPQMVYGLLQKVTMTSAPDVMMQGGITQFERYAGALTPQQKAAVDSWLPRLRAQSQSPSSSAASPAASNGMFGIGVDTIDVMRNKTNGQSLISFYAAGIGVMFLLFSVSGASGTLLDEVDSGTLDRLLSTRLGMGGVLTGKWLYLTLLGGLQLSVMFLWGRVAFKLDLFPHLPGFLVMTVFTAMAAGAFGLMLATIAHTRAQLSGISTVIILSMSAVGGSMFPRFLMSETMQKIGLLTFNAWALDGYLKVFWRDAPIWQLWPQLAVLTALTVVFMALARTFARRWETA